MAITYLEVDTQSLTSDVNGVIEEVLRARVSLNELVQEMDQLNAMWHGPANLAFKAQINSDVNAMNELLNKVDSLAESMQNAITEYNRCEVAVLGEVDNIKI